MNTSAFHSNNDPSLSPLASISYNNNLIRFMWRQKTREVIIQLPDMINHVVQQDKQIIDTLAELIHCKPHEISFTNLVVYEFPYKGEKATRELRNGIYSCCWSDYGVDKMGFECNIVLRSYVPESYYHAIM